MDPQNGPAKEGEESESPFDEKISVGKDALAEINFELLDTGRWLLKVIGGPNNGAEFAMQAGSAYVIGTDPNSCDVVFHDTSVSRQHARITINGDDNLSIEDLKSRNGTLVDGEPSKGKKTLLPNTVVTLGTTSFVVYDREGEMQTIISPLLPSIVKVLQKDEGKEVAAAKEKSEGATQPLPVTPPVTKGKPIGAYVALAMTVAITALLGTGLYNLFKAAPVIVAEQVDQNKILTDALASFPSLKWSYNKTTGRLLLVGHLLTATDKNQLIYNLQGIPFLRSMDDSGVIIDEYVWQDINQLLSNNPNWKGISIQSPSPGRFVLTGYLQTRKQAELLSQYITENFRYLDLLDKKVVVDEEVLAGITSDLQPLKIKNLAAQLSNGELTLSGGIPKDKLADYGTVLEKFRKIPGVRLIKNYVTELAPEASLINISDKYTVSGSSHAGKNINVVINGHILSTGDILDGMVITSIHPNVIMLEKDGVKYRIDYSR